MIDDINNPVMPEAQDNAPQEQSGEQESQSQPEVNDDQTRNFKQLREKTDRVSRERDEALARLRDYESRIRPSHPQAQEESDDFTMQPDELAEGKHISKVQKQLNKLKQEVRVATAEAKLTARFPDFYSVVSKENINALRDSYPEIAKTINASSEHDMYSAGVAAYDFIKSKGIGSSMYDAEKALVHRNASKPKPLASVSPQQGEGGALSKANAFAGGLTPELKKQLLREMEEVRRNS